MLLSSIKVVYFLLSFSSGLGYRAPCCVNLRQLVGELFGGVWTVRVLGCGQDNLNTGHFGHQGSYTVGRLRGQGSYTVGRLCGLDSYTVGRLCGL